MALLLALCPAGLAITVGGVAVRRVSPGHRLPWIYEADLLGSERSDTLASHDPLASTFWPAAVPLARLLSQLPGIRGARFVEVGCGCGLCTLSAASAGASVIGTDVEPLSLRLLEAAAAEQGLAVRTAEFDAMSPQDELPAADIYCVSDCFVTKPLATALAARTAAALAAGSTVLVVDPGRSTRDDFLSELRARGVAQEAVFRPLAELEDALLPPPDGTSNGRARRHKLILLDTSEGAPVSYCI